ncbi:MAG: CBS domain-containing protein [Gammaproteobacteria bacterium]|nr:CBS domain-containing protein [Gammaproteobacteria bacterium]
MKLVQHLLNAKGRNVISIEPETSVLDAIKLMAEKGIGSVVVMADGKLCGIMTERDYARKVIIKGRASDTTPVSDIMTGEVKTTSPDATVDSCMQMMTDLKCRHLPVVEGGDVVAMISIGDLVQAIIADQKEEIEQLEHYIAG